MKRTRRIKPSKICAYLLMVIHLVLVVLPLYIMVVTSFKTNKEVFKAPLALPSGLNLEGYEKVFRLNDFARFYLNSFIVTAAAILIFIFTGLLAAYAIARLRFRGSNFFYIYFLLGMMIPIRIGVLNMFRMFNSLKLSDSLFGLILIYSAMSIGFSVFIMTGFMRSIPIELEESAKLDGATNFRILWTIIVPIMKPAIATAIIYNFVPIWNDFYFPLIFIKTESLQTVPLAVTIFFGQYSTEWPTVFAALTIAAVPPLILYFIFSKQFIKGLTAGAVKG